MKQQKTIVTFRNELTKEHLYIDAQTFSNAWNTSGILNRIELQDHIYSQVRLRSSIPSFSKGYRWVSLVKWIGGA